MSTADSPLRAAPELGADTDDVLACELDLSPDDLEALRASGVIA